MAKMSDSEVLAYADKICKMVTADSPARRKEYCKFISHSKDRYCNASTHQNCNRCRFFEPTVFTNHQASLVDCVAETERNLSYNSVPEATRR